MTYFINRTEIPRTKVPKGYSIQFRHLYAPANKHHVGAHGEERKDIDNNKVHEWKTEKN